MGFGDFKLLAAIGAWWRVQALPLTILLSSFIGAAVGIALMIFLRHGRSVPIPFGPYLGVAGIVALFWDPRSPPILQPVHVKPYTVGLTGGIGSGKSVVAGCSPNAGSP